MPGYRLERFFYRYSPKNVFYRVSWQIYREVPIMDRGMHDATVDMIIDLAAHPEASTHLSARQKHQKAWIHLQAVGKGRRSRSPLQRSRNISRAKYCDVTAIASVKIVFACTSRTTSWKTMLCRPGGEQEVNTTFSLHKPVWFRKFQTARIVTEDSSHWYWQLQPYGGHEDPRPVFYFDNIVISVRVRLWQQKSVE